MRATRPPRILPRSFIFAEVGRRCCALVGLFSDSLCRGLILRVMPTIASAARHTTESQKETTMLDEFTSSTPRRGFLGRFAAAALGLGVPSLDPEAANAAAFKPAHPKP